MVKKRALAISTSGVVPSGRAGIQWTPHFLSRYSVVVCIFKSGISCTLDEEANRFSGGPHT